MNEMSKEVRFAVVMYGGISLAIYMNGIAQELLSLVRSTADNPEGGKSAGGTQPVYREVAAELRKRDLDENGHGFPVKFVIDILSGSSAGGINAVCLAKALTGGEDDLKSLESTWLEEGDIDLLMNDDRSEPTKYRPASPKTSLLNSQRMYAKLLEAFRRMKRDAARRSLIERDLDLFVTATDLKGIDVPIRLDDGMVHERIHKHVFHFRYRNNGRDGFSADNDPMLAFASRCTSSFPAAFEPVKLDDIRNQLGPGGAEAYEKGCEDWGDRFFRPFLGLAQPWTRRLFADGGYLDNRPFGHAIRAIQERPPTRPVERKLLFIDPFPDPGGAEKEAQEEISFVENIGLAAMTLPRYETIRGDIAEVKRMNRWTRRVDIIMKRIEGRIRKNSEGIAERRQSLPAYPELGLDDMLPLYGEAYSAYHSAKVYGVTDDIALAVTLAAGFDERSDLLRAIRTVVMAWRREHFVPTSEEAKQQGKQTENQFLARFDLGFRMRRLIHVRRVIEEIIATNDARPLLLGGNQPVRPSDGQRAYLRHVYDVTGKALDALHGLHEELSWSSGAHPLAQAVQELSRTAPHLRGELERILAEPENVRPLAVTDRLEGLPEETEQVKAWKVGRDVYADNRDALQGIVAVLEAKIREVTGNASRLVKGALGDDSESGGLGRRLFELYEYGFDLRDSLTLPLLAGCEHGEGCEIGIFRVSPIDATNLWPLELQRKETKLAGVAVGAFGGFLDRQWRRNDILWGRLDGAERIIAALLPGESARGARQDLIDRAHRAILEQYLAEWREELSRARHQSDVAAKRVGMLDTLLQSLEGNSWKETFRREYAAGAKLDPAVNLERIGRASRVLSSMVERLRPGEGPFKRIGNVLKRTGTFLLALVELSTPKSWPEVITAHFLMLLFLASFVVTGAGLFVKPFRNLITPGLILMALVTIAWLLKKWLGTRLHGVPFPRWVGFLLGLLALVLVLGLGTAVFTVVASFGKFWDLFVQELLARF